MHPDFAATLDYLYGLLPMYQRIGKAAYKKDLSNTHELCWALGRPQWRFLSLHVAGTNGKGSVASMLASICQEAGLRTGLYTSPHLLSFTERIRIDGQPMTEAAVVAFVQQHRDLIERIKPSFFELTVAMAFDHFATQAVDLAVVEVGLGGRLDSTNVLRPELCVITQIDYDHMDLLGDTLAQIASEKAGIIKPYTPVVIGARHPETDPVFEAAAKALEAPLLWAEAHYQPELGAATPAGQEWLVDGSRLLLGLAGHYQRDNLAAVLTAVDALREEGYDLPDEAVTRGLARVVTNTGLRGRMEVIGQAPTVICDTAHNEGGVRAVMEQLARRPYPRLHLVWGMVQDKAHEKILQLLPPAAAYYWVRPELARGLDAAALAAKGAALGLAGQVCGSVAAGIAAARAAAGPDDLIYIGGSTFVVADALAAGVAPEA